MEVIGATKVVTQTKRKDQPKIVQPGNRNFVTIIEGINATGWVLPTTIIFDGKVHQAAWYQTEMPLEWKIELTGNSWTNDEAGYKWLTEIFHKHTQHRRTGSYRLLFFDGHGSHRTDIFDDFCRKHQII